LSFHDWKSRGILLQKTCRNPGSRSATVSIYVGNYVLRRRSKLLVIVGQRPGGPGGGREVGKGRLPTNPCVGGYRAPVVRPGRAGSGRYGR